MNKLIFLDVDGVLNSSSTRIVYNEVYKTDRQMNPISVLLLLRLHLVSNCNFVISSAWRYMSDYGSIITTGMYNAGWPKDVDIPIVGKTPKMGDVWRGAEVETWIEKNSPSLRIWKDYVILDDTTDFFNYQPLVQVDARHGFSQEEFSVIVKAWDIPTNILQKYTFLTTTTTNILYNNEHID